MKKVIILFLAIFIGFSSFVKADEGMWLLPLLSKLNIQHMNEMGCKLTAEDIYSINHSSLKDAVVIFGGFCTGELISDQGLILTNHHCGYDAIQDLSSVENNYLKDGFWAKKQSEELHVDGLFVTFLKRMDDVTDKVLNGITDNMTEEVRMDSIQSNIKNITKEASKDNNDIVRVQSFFENNQYFLVIYEKYTDVRFVGAPPSSIGKFGFDTDNWMWPRHTGDFSMFRVYADKDGKPAKYSKDNVPLKPKYHLPISLKGEEKGDFSMTMGFPGSTNRYLTSWGIKERMNIINDSRITPRGIKQDIWQKDMLSDEKVNIQYASKFSRSSNYWKNSIGMNRGIKNLNVIEKKQELEKQFTDWVDSDSNRKERYGHVLQDLQSTYEGRAENLKAILYLNECLIRGTEIISWGAKTISLAEALDNEDAEKTKAAVSRIKSSIPDFYKNYNAPTDHKVFATILKLYYDKIPSQYHPSFFNDIVVKKYKGDFNAYADYVFKKSMFTDKEKLEAFLENPNKKSLEKDPVFIAANSTYEIASILSESLSSTRLNLQHNNRLFIEGLMKMNPEKTYYPDANFTMRLSYGKVGNYEPKDAVIYKYYTTLKGVMEKEDPNNFEFIVSDRLKELYNKKDYGQYAAKDGKMRVCFTTDNDITGGNSGSPVINANGELIGIAFDGNWEAMSGDIAFEPELQKCINVDIRYVLFIIDKYAGATNLINEMTLVN